MGPVECAHEIARRNELCRRVRTLVPQQPGKDMGVRTLGTSSVSRRYRLIHFNAPDPADEHAMGIGRQDNSHCIVAGFEQRSAGSFPYRRDDLRIASPNTSIELQRAKAEVEEDRRPIFRVQRIAIGADFGEDRAPIRCADVFGEAQCYAMTPALLVDHAEAIGRSASCASIRKPPRAVTAKIASPARRNETASSASLVNSAMAPNVPRSMRFRLRRVGRRAGREGQPIRSCSTCGLCRDRRLRPSSMRQRSIARHHRCRIPDEESPPDLRIGH